MHKLGDPVYISCFGEEFFGAIIRIEENYDGTTYTNYLVHWNDGSEDRWSEDAITMMKRKLRNRI